MEKEREISEFYILIIKIISELLVFQFNYQLYEVIKLLKNNFLLMHFLRSDFRK